MSALTCEVKKLVAATRSARRNDLRTGGEERRGQPCGATEGRLHMAYHIRVIYRPAP